MRRVSNVVIVLCWLAVCGLASYEIVQKSAVAPFGPLPGAALACRVDHEVRFRATTGILPLDRLLHEGEEAVVYYRDLARGRRR